MSACFHCDLPVREPGRHRAAVLGAPREFCCAGCEAVARTIVAAGFEKYYEARSASGVRPELLPPTEVYDDPLAQREFVATPSEHQREATLILDRIRCAACLWLNEQTLRRVPGVLRADVNFTTQRAQIAWDPRRTRLSQIVAAIRAVGYDAYPFDPRRGDALARGERRRALWRLFVAGFGAMQVMMYAWPAYVDAGAGTLSTDAAALMRWASLVITTPVLIFSCGPFFRGAWQDARRRRISLDTPIALGLAAGFAASAWATVTGAGEVYFDSIAMLAFLLLGARTAELFARQKAGRELDRLARWMPSFALRLREGETERVAAHALAPGDLVRVGAGERVPADGDVTEGASSADESLLTGESRPVEKRAGALLVGGSVNLEQPLVIRVTRAGADTQAAAIGRLVERAAASRPALVERADYLAQILTSVVIATAALAWAVSGNVWIAVAVLVATCPCALALAAPIVLTRAGAQLLARGAALTRSRALEALERATDVVLDKTGTLTLGKPAVARVVTLANQDEEHCGALAAALEASSTHPLARAFGTVGQWPTLRDLRNEAGHGVEARADGRLVRIGSRRFCEQIAGAVPSAADAQVFLAEEGRWLAAFFVEDGLRPEAGDVVRALTARGLRLHLVSGDDSQIVGALAARFGIERWQGGATPQDKLDYVSRLQAEGCVVAMVGDGLNDAPVLARADASVAMGAGADVAQMQADVVLTADRLGALQDLLEISRRAMRLVRQNLGWALAYNALALPAAALGWIGPWEAALGMSASSFIVVLNALRPLAKEAKWKASPSSSPSRSLSYS
ncbi:MAG: heavy metal translocating P-type ATPase [Betaproteobacteria bacterium]|nr:heavy metal translocating P-type ATPase [Betaproteobacteria bacterium]